MFKRSLPIFLGVLVALVSFKLIFEFAALSIYEEKSRLNVQDPYKIEFEVLNRKITDRRKLNIFRDEELQRLLTLRQELTNKNKRYFDQIESVYWEKERSGKFQPTIFEVWDRHWLNIVLIWGLINFCFMWFALFINQRIFVKRKGVGN